MTECHEFGVAMFDVVKEDVQNYHASEEETPHKKRKIERKYRNVKKEGKIMQTMLEPLAHAYMALLVDRNGPGGGVKKQASQSSKGKRKQLARGSQSTDKRKRKKEMLKVLQVMFSKKAFA